MEERQRESVWYEEAGEAFVSTSARGADARIAAGRNAHRHQPVAVEVIRGVEETTRAATAKKGKRKAAEAVAQEEEYCNLHPHDTTSLRSALERKALQIPLPVPCCEIVAKR
jgi:hypothetical protein